MPSQKSHYLILLLFIISTSMVAAIPRADFYVLISVVAASFLMYAKSFELMKHWGLGLGIFFVVIIRVAFFFELPMLSDDFYRFLWDGMLMNEGVLSIGNIPQNIDVAIFSNPDFAQGLLDQMNSAQYPSIYPPFHQFVSGAAYLFGQESILGGVNTIRLLFLLVEVGFLVYVCYCANSMMRYALFYLMNPLVIIEGFGNVHIEAMVAPLVGIALIELIRRNPVQSAASWVTTILIKFVPLILAPMLFFRFGKRQRWVFAGAAALILAGCILLLNPIEIFNAFRDGLEIYYGVFEFNASFYYVFRELISAVLGYNPIGFLAPIMALLILLSVLYVSYFKHKAGVMELALVVFIIYMLGTATVHPWYMLPIVLFSTFSNRYYLLIWSGLVFLSYSHYYGELGPKWGFVIVEYVGLGIAIWMEGKKERWLQSAFRG